MRYDYRPPLDILNRWVRSVSGFGKTVEIFDFPREYAPRSVFLKSLQNGRANKYKRYNGLPLRYAGGKSLAVGHILKYFPDGLTDMASPFIGGGAIEIACARELGINVQAYDIFDLLTNFWQIILEAPEKLADKLSTFQPDKSEYEAIKKRLKAHWKGEKKLINKIDIAAHYWFNHNLSYGPGFLGWMSSIYECPKRYKRLIEKVRFFKCPNLSVKMGKFENTIPAHNGTFLYCDPPYYLDDGKMFKGIYPQRNFPIHHKGFDHLILNKLLKQHKGGFILSYNDCDTIRNLYSDYRIVDVGWQYTMGQGETRIGKNRVGDNATHVKQSHEILVVSHG